MPTSVQTFHKHKNKINSLCFTIFIMSIGQQGRTRDKFAVFIYASAVSKSFHKIYV